MPDSAASIVARLAAATRASVEVRTDAGAGGAGEGAVTVERDGDVLVVSEAGEWTFGGRPIRFRATTRWQIDGDTLVVDHVRQGEPAHLVLEREPGVRWRSREAWRCGSDRYEVAVEVDPEAVTVVWVISGPCKGSHIATRYR